MHSDAYNQGYQAYLTAPICPHDEGTREWYAWYMQGQIKIPYAHGTEEYSEWTDGYVEAHIDADMEVNDA